MDMVVITFKNIYLINLCVEWNSMYVCTHSIMVLVYFKDLPVFACGLVILVHM
jgi:hypothetical protein